MRKLLLFLWLTLPVHAVTFYVTTNGNDTANGSLATPWLTIDKAIGSAGVGATVYVGQGFYKTNAVDFNALNFSVASQTFIASNNVWLGQVFVTANSVTLSNFNIGYNFYGGFSSDPIFWFKTGSDNSTLAGGSIISANASSQWGVIFDSGGCVMKDVDMRGTLVGATRVWNGTPLVQFDGTNNQCLRVFMHDIDNAEAAFYIWGTSNRITSCTISNYNDNGMGGSHPDLFQSWDATSYGTIIESNLLINSTCAIGNTQPMVNQTNYPVCGFWTFRYNRFINVGNKFDVDFPNVTFQNNTFYNCGNAAQQAHVINFNDSIFGKGTNGFMANNIFYLSGADPTVTNQGWFGVDPTIASTAKGSNNFVIGANFWPKDSSQFSVGQGWINGGNPYLVWDRTTRRTINITGNTYASNTVNIVGTNTIFLTELQVGDYITLAPWSGSAWKYTNIDTRITAIADNTHLTVATATGDGSQQVFRREQNYDPLPDLTLMKQSPAIGAAFGGGDIGALGWDKNQLVRITFRDWPGQSNCVDVTGYTNHGYVINGSTNWPTLNTNGPNGSLAAHIGANQYFAATNAINTFGKMTNGAVVLWVNPDTGFEPGTANYGYYLDVGFSFPETYGFTFGHDPGNSTAFYAYDASGVRFKVLSFTDWTTTTNWHHYAVTWDGTNAYAYFDGAQLTNAAMGVPYYQVDSAGWLAIGTMQHDGVPIGGTYPNAAFLNGSVADIHVYNRTPSAAEIQGLYLGTGTTASSSGGGGSPDPSISVQPQSQTVTAPATATFSVTASGLSALSYQWNWYGTNVTGATSASWTTPAIVTANSGSTVYVTVTDTAGSLQSASVTLTVNSAAPPGQFRAITMTTGVMRVGP